MNVSHIRLAIALAVGLLMTGVVAAQPASRYGALPKTKVERTVSLRDLDLRSERGLRQAYGRLHRAARVVCDAQRSYPRAYIKEVIRPCVADALARSVSQAGSPSLRAYHERRTAGTRWTQLREHRASGWQ